VVLNLKIGLCSPQYHVVFDDQFTTLPYLYNNQTPPQWPDLFHHSRINVLEGEPEIQSQIKLGQEWRVGVDTTHSEGVINASEGVPLIAEGAQQAPHNTSQTNSQDETAKANYDAVASSSLPQDDLAMANHDAVASSPLLGDPAQTNKCRSLIPIIRRSSNREYPRYCLFQFK
jgi:hypothetical protein